MDVATTPAIQAIGADSVLTLGFAFFRDGGEVTWDVAELWMSAQANDPNYIMAVRAQVPAPSMDDEDRNEWDRIPNRQSGCASCRVRVCQYVYISAVAASLNKQLTKQLDERTYGTDQVDTINTN